MKRINDVGGKFKLLGFVSAVLRQDMVTEGLGR